MPISSIYSDRHRLYASAVSTILAAATMYAMPADSLDTSAATGPEQGVAEVVSDDQYAGSGLDAPNVTRTSFGEPELFAQEHESFVEEVDDSSIDIEDLFASIQEVLSKYKNIRRLASYRALEQNWNGYGGDPVDDAAIDQALSIITSDLLAVQPEVFPTGRGSVQLENELLSGDYIEFEIFANRISMYREYADGEDEEVENLSPADVVQRFNEFYGA